MERSFDLLSSEKKHLRVIFIGPHSQQLWMLVFWLYTHKILAIKHSFFLCIVVLSYYYKNMVLYGNYPMIKHTG